MSETILGGMMTVGNTYMFINSADTSRTLRVWCDGSYPAGNLSNVCLWERSDSDTTQQWTLVNSGGHYLLKPVVNSSKALDLYTGSGDGSNYNAQLYAPSNTSWLSFEPAANYKIHIKLESNSSKYLTANQNSSGTRTGIKTNAPGNVYFWGDSLTDGSQEWIVREISAGQSGGDTPSGDSNLGNGTITVGQHPTTFNINHSGYSAAINNFHGDRIGSYGQCTWYCYGRAHEVLGKRLTFSATSGNHAGTWYNRITNGVKMQTPVANSIAVWSGGRYGHVAYVEKVVGDLIYFTEANWDANDDNAYNPATDAIVKVFTLNINDTAHYYFKKRSNEKYILTGYVKLT